jgi:hypothetical protein
VGHFLISFFFNLAARDAEYLGAGVGSHRVLKAALKAAYISPVNFRINGKGLAESALSNGVLRTWTPLLAIHALR